MTPVAICVAVEGDIDEAVARRLIRHVGAAVGNVYRRRGKGYLQENIRRFNQAARRFPWFVLVDLDDKLECAPVLKGSWLPDPASLMCFRVAVREVEAWLLADREGFAEFLGVSEAIIPLSPETIQDPKQTIINLAARSSRRAIRQDMLPLPGSGLSTGRYYNDSLVEFALEHWRPDTAAGAADSLRRCLERLRSVVEGN